MAETCGECGREFGGPVDLVQHEKEAHGRDPLQAPPSEDRPTPPPGARETRRREPFVCSVCHEVFRTREALARHNLSGHDPPGVSTPA
ncbi:MAG: C2H2-type zinc finger protein [Thermoplasmata archaeon]